MSTATRTLLPNAIKSAPGGSFASVARRWMATLSKTFGVAPAAVPCRFVMLGILVGVTGRRQIWFAGCASPISCLLGRPRPHTHPPHAGRPSPTIAAPPVERSDLLAVEAKRRLSSRKRLARILRFGNIGVERTDSAECTEPGSWLERDGPSYGAAFRVWV